MCAIAGAIGVDISEANIQKMEKTMERRGPDGKGIYKDGSCLLLHSRLAIIDPDGGKQPMELKYGGKTYCISYNGELYNTDEIRMSLKSLGHSFKTHSDTEVVLHAFAQWREKSLEYFNGIFAFAVWCIQDNTLFFARDRIGVKPLFYAQCGMGLLFASEIKTILQSGMISPALSQEGAMEIIMLGPGRIPGSGVFQNIHALEPGCYGVFTGGSLKIERYWYLRDCENTDTFEQTVEKTRFLVEDAIKRQMVSDVEIGTFLSGGLDSSIISAVCAKEFQKGGKQLKTFSVDYLNNDKYFQPGKFQPDADTPYIKLMQEEIHSAHQWTSLSAEELEASLEDATLARDLPGMADVDFSLLAFCGDIRSKVKVALSGECADEIFGGYPWYRDPEVRQKAGFPWAQNIEKRSELLLDSVKNRCKPTDFVMDLYQKTCDSSDILPGTDSVERRMKQMMNLNFQWFMQTLLDRKDRMSMYHGLEVRVPFCDYRIAEYLYTVPWKYKDYMGREKGLLRYAVQDLLPQKIVYRKKSPYPKTFDPHYDELMTKRLNAIIESDSPIFHIISPLALKSLLSAQTQWPWYGQLMRHAQTCAFFIQMDFWLKAYQIDFLF